MLSDLQKESVPEIMHPATAIQKQILIMSGMLPNSISSAGVSASEIPDGFSLGGPNSSGGGVGGPSDSAAEQTKQRQAQREAILEQAMTPDALARLRRVKVSK